MDSIIPAEKKNALSEASKQLNELSAIVADWLSVYAQVYREQNTDVLALAYLEALKDLKPLRLHQAFLRAMKEKIFRPTPAEVREAAVLEAENEGPYREAEKPPMSDAERQETAADWEALRQRLFPIGRMP